MSAGKGGEFLGRDIERIALAPLFAVRLGSSGEQAVYALKMDAELRGPDFWFSLSCSRYSGYLGEEGLLKATQFGPQIEKRFGPLPDWAEKRLIARSASELEDLSVRGQGQAAVLD